MESTVGITLLNPVYTINLSLYFQKKKKKENDIKYKS